MIGLVGLMAANAARFRRARSWSPWSGGRRLGVVGSGVTRVWLGLGFGMRRDLIGVRVAREPGLVVDARRSCADGSGRGVWIGEAW